MALRQFEQPERLMRAFDRRHRGQLRGRFRIKLQGRACDDAQCAFSADEQVAQVITGIVFSKPAQTIPDFTIGGHHFQAKAQLTGIAIAQHLPTAGVGGKIAADRATALRRQGQRKQPMMGAGSLLDLKQGAAGINGNGVVDRIDGADRFQSGE